MTTETKTAMKTQDAVNKFLDDCRYRGLAPSTIGSRASHLKHFVLELPELSTEWGPIDRFLTRVIKKKSARYNIRRTLLAFYKYLDEQHITQNPIPPLKVGRPNKPVKNQTKLGRGGSDISLRVDLHIFIHEASD